MLAVATIQNRAKELPPRRTARCHALANGGPRSVVRLFAHRSIASCDINILPFTTHVNKAQTPLPTTNPALELEVIFCVQGVMRLWFANLILYSAALTVAGCYVPFTDIGAGVMKMLADTRGIKIDEKDKGELTERFSTMPPHSEVPAALRKLHNAGFRLFTLTDNLLEVQTRQLTHGGIADLFERRFSADGVKHHKPS